MGTRSWIGIRMPDGKVKYIYCHCDGYVKGGVGQLLDSKYTTLDVVQALIDGGDCSYIEEEDGPYYHNNRKTEANTVKEPEFIKGSWPQIEYIYMFDKDSGWSVREVNMKEENEAPVFVPIAQALERASE